MPEIRDLSFSYGDHAVFSGLNLSLPDGSRTALLAPSGYGKTTLLRLLCGSLVPQGGSISGLLDQGIGMVFQEPEHQFAANFVRDEVSIGPKSMGQSQDEAYQTADRMLEQMNLTRFAKANPYTLSGGEKRRLSVASMLAAAPKVLVMDEPTFGQDFSTWNEMVKLIAAIRDQGSCVIMVTHDEALVDALGARRVMFEEAKA